MRGPKWNEKTVERFQAEGRGRGVGSAYRPWITVADFSSLGESRRVWSTKTGRHHELFSDVEYNLFICLEWDSTVEDIREQYPLDRSVTLQIAQELGIRHPCYPGTKVPTVMTVDFLVTHRRQHESAYEAYNAKRDEEAEDEGSLVKLEIQRAYFEMMESPHHLVFHSSIPKQKAKNIDWIRHAALKPGEIEPHADHFASLKTRLAGELVRLAMQQTSLNAYCTSFDTRHGLETGTGLRVARMLMQDRILVPNLEHRDLATAPLSTFLVTGSQGRLRSMGH